MIGLRIWSALAAFATVVTGGLLAREFGGGRTAQLLGALGVAAKTASIDPVAPETIGWPQFVSTVSRVWHQLPAGQRARAVIFTGNYGEAGAVTELGRADGLPAAVSGQNNEWYWGPGRARATTVVAIVQPGFPELVTQLHHDFAQVRAVATIGNPEHVSNQEEGARVYLCTGPVRPWGQLWPSFRFDS